MIPAETRYETYKSKLLAIVKAFKTWRHYLEGCKHEIFILIDYNNLCQFMNTKSLSSCQFRWSQKLSRYHLRIDYCQEKANGVANVLSCFSQKNQAKVDKLQTENTRILYKLQSSLINASLLGLSTQVELSPLYQVLIYGIYVLL